MVAKFEYKAYSNLAASKIESLYIQSYMVILWPNIEYRAKMTTMQVRLCDIEYSDKLAKFYIHSLKFE